MSDTPGSREGRYAARAARALRSPDEFFPEAGVDVPAPPMGGETATTPQDPFLKQELSTTVEHVAEGEPTLKQEPLRTGRALSSPSTITTAAVLWFLTVLVRNALLVSSAKVRSDAVQLAGVRKSFGTPRAAQQDPNDFEPMWFEAWKLVLHNQIDGLCLAIEQRLGNSSSEESGVEPAPAGPSLHVGGEGKISVDFKIAMVGDSTMRMQTIALSWLLGQRDELACKGTWLSLKCSKAVSDDEEDGGNPPAEKPGLFISVLYVKTIQGCKGRGVNADFVYFGCGLRLLQLIPDRRSLPGALDTWVNYERSLEEAILYYRSGGSTKGKRVPVGEAFMTTHSFADEVLNGMYEFRVGMYEARNESTLATCRETVGEIEPVHADWESDYEPEDICTHGVFDQAGVQDLNRRAEPVMRKLGVPMVRGYDITQGQVWATLPQDGRHYPAMIPVELNSFLSEITTALRIEKRAASGGA